MREILFRGQDLNRIWYTGNLIELDNGCVITINKITNVDDSMGGYNALSFNIDEIAVVIPDTVGQFTGKHYNTPKRDKSTHCFESDIAFSEDEGDDGEDIRNYCVCTWIHDWSAFVWLSIEEYNNYLSLGKIEDEIGRAMFDLDMDRMHYAGTIFDNPELLKGE